MKHALAIIFLCIGCAVSYGIVHDQVTARICVEYFSITHPKIIDSTSPGMLALAWGVAATWWVGAILGVGLALAARAGSPPLVDAGSLVKPVLALLAVMGVAALAMGIIGLLLDGSGTIHIPREVGQVVPAEKHHRWMGVWWAHNTSYAVGFVGGLALITRTLWQRRTGRAVGTS